MRNVIFIGLLILFLVLAVSCGGVQRNPATPPWGQGQQPQGQLPQGEGKEGKTAAAGGQGKILEGDYDSLIPQAESFLEKGDLENAFNAYHSALQQKAGDAQAGMGKAICQIAKDWRTFAVFRGAGADKLYYTTPLLMHSELLPSPITADDSYLLRLLTIGRRYEETFNVTLPSWGLKPVNPNKETKPPETAGAGKKPVEGEEKPKEGSALKEPPEEGTPDEKPPEEGGEQPPNGGTSPDEEQPDTQMKPRGEGLVWSHKGWVPLSNRTGQQRGGPSAGGPEEWEELQEQYKASGGLPPGTGVVAPPPPVQVKLPDGTKPIDSEYFKTEVPLTIAKLEDEAGTLRIENFRTIPTNMHNNLVGLISLLESISSGVTGDFIFQAGFVLRDKTEKYEIVFRKQDYDLMLAELRILAGITGFVTSYNSTANIMTYVYQVKDANTDGKYSPEEYYPPAPFGTILDGGKDLLAEAKDNYLQGLEETVELWDLALERALNAPTESTNEILALPGSGDAAVGLESRKKLYSDFASEFDETIDMALDGKGGKVEIKVAPAVLFKNVLGDVRALLPCVDMMGSLVSCSESGEVWPNDVFSGLFPDGLKDDTTVVRMGKIKGKAANSSYIVYQGGDITYAGGKSEISENGEFLLSGVEFNELTGLQVTLTPKEGEPWKGSLHSMNECIFTFPEILGTMGGMSGLTPPGLGGTTTPHTGGDSTGTVIPGDDGGGTTIVTN